MTVADVAPVAWPSGLTAALGEDPRLVHVEQLASRPAATSTLSKPLPVRVRDALAVDELWSHQVEAIELLRSGRSVVIATSTSSGKSLCSTAPIAEAMVADQPATALALYPTKALAQDQLRTFGALELPEVVAATYDGDATPEARIWARRNANVVLTNPEMLHQGLLPAHERWATFLLRLRYVVVDELHVLRGVFGSHTAHVLRRLRRLCHHYGSDPTFCFTSGTIGEPERLASDLCGLPVTAVTADGSPRGARTVALWDPAADGSSSSDPSDGPGDVDDTGSARSAIREAARLTAALVRSDRRTITFCRGRRATEIVATEARRLLPAALSDAVVPYRAGYLPEERRAIEGELFAGRLRSVVATSALELGIDVGGLDACVITGFPGTIASFWQQVGRAGRNGADSLAVLVAGDDQLDQWVLSHPAELLTRPPEPAVVNPSNPEVVVPQLACAAFELPLTHADERWWPGQLDDAVRRLVGDDLVRVRTRSSGPRAVWAGAGRPADRVGLRRAGSGEVLIVDDDETIVGTVDHGRAPQQVHPGAVYLHNGTAWRVSALDLDDGIARVESDPGTTTTQVRTDIDVAIATPERTTAVGQLTVGLGAVTVTSQVVGYRELEPRSGRVVGRHQLDLPAQVLHTRGFSFTVSPALLAAAGVSADAVAGALHAIEHAAIGVMPLFAICDRWDVGGVSTPLQAVTGLPTIVIHDAHPGGSGVAELGWASAAQLLATTVDLVADCGCVDGCPSCVQSPKCGNGNEPLDKDAAVALLQVLLDETAAAVSAA
jgi:DEAD/DEAH box helicase domain-containing protein